MDLSRRISDVSNTCSGGELDVCEGRIRPFLEYTLECVSESVMLQKTRLARAGGKLNKGHFAAVTTRTSYASCSDRPIKCSLSGGETA